MTLSLDKNKPYKAYIKKLENGFGIKTINTTTGFENILIITSDSIKTSHRNKKAKDPENDLLLPLLSKFSNDTVRATVSIPDINKSTFAINKILAHLEPYLRELKPTIAGFHIFEEGDIKSTPNVQKTSVIFVANTNLAKEQGIHFNIPGKLMNVFLVDSQNQEGKIKFVADSIVKPLTIIVSDYVLHIDICYETPFTASTKTVGTQTKKRYILTSSFENNVPVYEVESFVQSKIKIKHEQKSTQTNFETSLNEATISNSNLNVVAQDLACRMNFLTNSPFMSNIVQKNYTLVEKSHLKPEESVINNSFLASETEIIRESKEFDSSVDSVKSFDSHINQTQSSVLSHNRNQDYELYNVTNDLTTQASKDLVTNKKNQNDSTFTLFDNSINYIYKVSSNEQISQNFESENTNSLFKENISQTVESTEKPIELLKDSSNSYHNIKEVITSGSSTNISVKDLKERLNKTTISLQKLYSVVEMLEKRNERCFDERIVQENEHINAKQCEREIKQSSSSRIILSPKTQEEQIVHIKPKKICSQESNMKDSKSQRVHTFEGLERGLENKSHEKIFSKQCSCIYTDIAGAKCNQKKKNSRKLAYKKISVSEEISNSNISKTQVNPKDTKNIISTTLNNNSTTMTKVESRYQFQDEATRASVSLTNNIKNSKSSFEEKLHDLIMNESRQINLSNTQEEIENFSIDSASFAEDEFRRNANETESICLTNNILESKNSQFFLHENEDGIVNQKGSSIKICTTEENFTLHEENKSVHSLTNYNIEQYEEEQSKSTLQTTQDSSGSTVAHVESNISITDIENSLFTQNLTNCHSSLHVGKTNSSKFKDTFNNRTTNHGSSETRIVNLRDSFEPTQSSLDSGSILLLKEPDCSDSHKNLEHSNEYYRLENSNIVESKLLYLNEIKTTKSQVNFKKSLKFCSLVENLKSKGESSKAEPNTDTFKILSSGDQLGKSTISQHSISYGEGLNLIGLFNNSNRFRHFKYSSSNTLHIMPSSHELQEAHYCKISSSKDRESSKKSLSKFINSLSINRLISKTNRDCEYCIENDFQQSNSGKEFKSENIDECDCVQIVLKNSGNKANHRSKKQTSKRGRKKRICSIM